MAKLINSDITSYEFSLKKSFRSNHLRSKFRKLNKIHTFEPGSFYTLSLKSVSYGSFKFKHFQMFQKFLNYFKPLKRKTYLRVRPYLNSTKKPSETRMGKGKGVFSEKIAPIFPGLIVIEVRLELYDNILDDKSFQDWLSRRESLISDSYAMLTKIKTKLPFKTKIVLNDV